MQAIKTGEPVVELSVQEGVDCDKESEGCNGGFMWAYWKMSSEIGSQAEETYKNEDKDGSCRNQTNKKVVSKAKYSTYKRMESTNEMRQ